MLNKNQNKSVTIIPGIIAGITIAVIAFLLSFDALRQLFIACGVTPALSWGGPICVDGTILLTTWAVWGFRKNRIRGAAYPWIGFIAFSLVSILGNALHAYLQDGGTLPRWVAPAVMSIPPVALMYATHLIVIIAGDWQDKTQSDGDAETPVEPLPVSFEPARERETVMVVTDEIARTKPKDATTASRWVQADIFQQA